MKRLAVVSISDTNKGSFIYGRNTIRFVASVDGKDIIDVSISLEEGVPKMEVRRYD